MTIFRITLPKSKRFHIPPFFTHTQTDIAPSPEDSISHSPTGHRHTTCALKRKVPSPPPLLDKVLKNHQQHPTLSASKSFFPKRKQPSTNGQWSRSTHSDKTRVFIIRFSWERVISHVFYSIRPPPSPLPWSFPQGPVHICKTRNWTTGSNNGSPSNLDPAGQARQMPFKVECHQKVAPLS